MPGMTGVEFLEAARRLDESARRVLLTAYADTEAAIAAVNIAGASHYLLKPWQPPEVQLYPALDDDLASWRAGTGRSSPEFAYSATALLPRPTT